MSSVGGVNGASAGGGMNGVDGVVDGVRGGVPADDARQREAAMVELAALSDHDRGFDEPAAVCPEHLRFLPCRRCPPGAEQRSTDPVDVERTVRFQHGDDAADQYRAATHPEHVDPPTA